MRVTRTATAGERVVARGVGAARRGTVMMGTVEHSRNRSKSLRGAKKEVVLLSLRQKIAYRRNRISGHPIVSKTNELGAQSAEEPVKLVRLFHRAANFRPFIAEIFELTVVFFDRERATAEGLQFIPELISPGSRGGREQCFESELDITRS
ncbi:unnamed protein product [Cuscuta europaea]|uniref:Uncharacterized protein n=1 Tax=Cuscuta europaea TaxID=41803 RepID=A0A9P1EAH1_CUSEU|nr:unnamed protein product [Cuscuta europaea]